jgi:hypothetical protein
MSPPKLHHSSRSTTRNIPAAEARRRSAIEAEEPVVDVPDIQVAGALPDFSKDRTAVQTGLANIPSREDFVGPRQKEAGKYGTTFAKQNFTEDEYIRAVDTFRGAGLISANRIKRELGVGTPKARAIFEETLQEK